MIKPLFTYCQKNIGLTNGGERERVLNRHAGLAPFEDKGKKQKLSTPVLASRSLLGHLKKPESEEVTEESIRKKNNN